MKPLSTAIRKYEKAKQNCVSLIHEYEQMNMVVDLRVSKSTIANVRMARQQFENLIDQLENS